MRIRTVANAGHHRPHRHQDRRTAGDPPRCQRNDRCLPTRTLPVRRRPGAAHTRSPAALRMLAVSRAPKSPRSGTWPEAGVGGPAGTVLVSMMLPANAKRSTRATQSLRFLCALPGHRRSLRHRRSRRARRAVQLVPHDAPARASSLRHAQGDDLGLTSSRKQRGPAGGSPAVVKIASPVWRSASSMGAGRRRWMPDMLASSPTCSVEGLMDDLA